MAPVPKPEPSATPAKPKAPSASVRTTKAPPAPAKAPAKATAKAPVKRPTAAPAPAPAKGVVKATVPARPPAKVARPATKATTRKVPADKFLAEQQELLLHERASHLRQAEELKDEADALAAEMEPGESEFGEEGGEGGNLSIERELDLVLSAQAKGAVEEIDRALAKIDAGTYGVCEKCGKEIPRARLKALPHAPLCVACKSGGLSRR